MSFLAKRRHSAQGRSEKKSVAGILRLSKRNLYKSSHSVSSGLGNPRIKADSFSTWLDEGTTYSALSKDLARASSLRPAHAAGKKTVGWDVVEVRDYERTIGDNPSCTRGVPISIGWSFTVGLKLPLQEYEDNRPPRRSNHEMLMTAENRRKMMMDEWGSTQQEVAAAIRMNQRIKNRRRKTVNNVGTIATKMEEVAERVRRKTKRLVMQHGSVQDEALALLEASEMAHMQRVELCASSQCDSSDQDTISVTNTMAAAMTAAWELQASQYETTDGISSRSSGTDALRAFGADNGTEKPSVPERKDNIYSQVESSDLSGNDFPGETKLAKSSSVNAEKAEVALRDSGPSDDNKFPPPIADIVLPTKEEPVRSGYQVDVADDDDISLVSELSCHSALSTAKRVSRHLRHQLVEEANERYRQQKALDARIAELDRKLEERRAEASKKESKTSWFGTDAPKSPHASKYGRKKSTDAPTTPTRTERERLDPKTPTMTPRSTAAISRPVFYTPKSLSSTNYLIAFDDQTELSC